MDPNTALANLRNIVGIARAVEMSSPFTTAVCEAFESLDEWIMRGGFLPTDWADAQGAAHVPPDALACLPPPDTFTGLQGNHPMADQ